MAALVGCWDVMSILPLSMIRPEFYEGNHDKIIDAVFSHWHSIPQWKRINEKLTSSLRYPL